MAIERSYGRILWRNHILGFHMVNPHGDHYFIYADPLINICRHPGQFIRVKRKDREPNPNKEHHPGEIYGSISETTEMDQTYIVLNLYLGPAEIALALNPKKTGLLNALEKQEYIFPQKEFMAFATAIEAMHEQHSPFTQLLMNGEILS